MMESRNSYGYGYVGSSEKRFEWLFTPDEKDVAYQRIPGTDMCYPCCCCKSGDVFKSESAAIRNGLKWVKEAGRSGAITAVKATPLHFEN